MTDYISIFAGRLVSNTQAQERDYDLLTFGNHNCFIIAPEFIKTIHDTLTNKDKGSPSFIMTVSCQKYKHIYLNDLLIDHEFDFHPKNSEDTDEDKLRQWEEFCYFYVEKYINKTNGNFKVSTTLMKNHLSIFKGNCWRSEKI